MAIFVCQNAAVNQFFSFWGVVGQLEVFLLIFYFLTFQRAVFLMFDYLLS